MRKLISLVFAISILTIAGPPAEADADRWELIEGKAGQTACALDDKGESTFGFYFRQGDPDKLAIFFDGGGACWDPNTCLLAPTYDSEIDKPEAVAAFGGIGKVSERNPINDYTQVFIPYCTGDLHTGSSDQDYTLIIRNEAQQDIGARTETVRHRGADNVAFVLNWLRKHYKKDFGYAPREVFLSGASAGGYGVLYHMPAIAEMLPWYARIRVLVDAANGVITQDFYDRTLAQGGVWNVQENLSPVLQSAFASGPDDITVETFKSLAHAYPYARFGQYTTAYDFIQIGFFNIARNTDRPKLWQDPRELAAAAFEWTLRARTYQILTALQTWNYRYYTAAGTDHTIVGEDKFYTENSAQGVFFRDWVDDMINRRWLWWNNDWRNVSCAPNCLQ